MNLPIPLWAVLAALPALMAFNIVTTWLDDQYEADFTLPLRRRWYGAHAHVTLRADKEQDDPARYTVIAWDSDHTAVPWLLVHKLDPDYLTSYAQDAEAFWAPVTHFAPYTVRRFRPHIEHYGRLPVPWLTRYLPLSQPSAYLGGEPDAA